MIELIIDSENNSCVKAHFKCNDLKQAAVESMLAVQVLFEQLAEEDVRMAIAFAESCRDGFPFIEAIRHMKEKQEKSESKEDSDIDDNLEDIKPIFQGILNSNPKKDGDSDAH